MHNPMIKLGSGTSCMEPDGNGPLHRTASQHSTASTKSRSSQTVRHKPKRHASCVSSSASSVSDKSLTSFPSFSSDSHKDQRKLKLPEVDGTANSPRKPSGPSIVDILTTTPIKSQIDAQRPSLFDDGHITNQHVPGALHLVNDEHIERLIARHGAVALVRHIAEDLAQRDVQISTMRRKAEERERALRKIILECGLSNLDLETRLRAVESGKANEGSNGTSGSGRPVQTGAGLEDLIDDAMSETVTLGDQDVDHDATIRVSDIGNQVPCLTKTWKDYLWGGTSRRSSRASSVNGEVVNGADSRLMRDGRPTVFQTDLFQPPETSSMKSSSRASSIHSTHVNRDRRPSGLAALALKLVAGSATTIRDTESSNRQGRANSATVAPSTRSVSPSSVNSRAATKAPSLKSAPKPIPRRTTVVTQSIPPKGRSSSQERWDTMGSSPQSTNGKGSDNFGPVEMDSILPLEAQPPILQTYNNPWMNQEFLTDRFGFIYDQRRKKRQKEAAERISSTKRRSRVEMLNSSRSGISTEYEPEEPPDSGRPSTPASGDDRAEDGRPLKRWQDYLKVATFPTELLSHTPSGGEAFEVMEGGEVPRSPGMSNDERGFVPLSKTASRPAVSITSDLATISNPQPEAPPTEDAEPVKLLLEQLGDVHDSLQREKTVKWNDFLRKVRAERKRDGETAAAKQAAAGDTRAITVLPEVSLADGEMIGVAGLGNKGKVGRAKWNELKSLVLGGIPVAYRAKIWAECSGATALRLPGYYEDLVAHRKGEDDPTVIAQINMDINRTLTDNIFFRKGPGVSKLNEVLLAYSRRNPEVGYCQGMNLITASLLLIMPTAEDAFWLLTSIIEHTLPRGYYDHSLLASRADQQVLRSYVSEVLPKLSQHLDDLSIELEALTFQWFLSVFTDCLSAEALFRVWDVVFCTNDGSTFLFQVALALLKLNERELLLCSTPAGVYTYINHQMTNHAISIDGLIHASEGLKRVVRREDVESRRVKAVEREKEAVRVREERNRLRRVERMVKENEAEHNLQENAGASTAASSVRELDSASEDLGELTVKTPMPLDENEEVVLV